MGTILSPLINLGVGITALAVILSFLPTVNELPGTADWFLDQVFPIWKGAIDIFPFLGTIFTVVTLGLSLELLYMSARWIMTIITFTTNDRT